MKHILVKCTLIAVAALQLSVTTAMAQASGSDIPIIERELFFDNPEIAGGQLSPDGKMVSFLKANNGILNIWVKKFDEPFEKARPLTASKEPMGGYFWTYDGKYILYVNDLGGNENYNIFAVDPRAAADAATGLPPSRNLTPNEKVRAYIFNVSKKNPDVLWVGLNSRDEKWHDLYKLEISTGKLTLLEENKDRLTSWVFDWDENARLATRSPEDGSTEILKKESNGSYKKVYDCGTLENCNPIAFTKDNKKVYIETNKGSDVDLSKLVVMDMETLKLADVEKDPLNKVDFGNVSFSDITRDMLYVTYTDAKTRIYFKDKKAEEDYNFIKKKFPGREVSFNSSTNDEKKFLVSVWSDDKLPEVHFFDRNTRELVFQYTPRPKLKPYEQYFAKMEPITYKSSDGLEIPAYLTVPKGMEAKNLPLLVLPHGGPWSRDYWGYSGWIQWLANRGYAVLQMNFRGSTGYGKKFIDAGNKQWGMKMQDDITWGVKHLVAKGIADPKRVAIMGGSYGGYATLAGLAFTPDVYAAGVDIVGPSNLITLLNSIPPYWEAGRKIFTERMGDPATPEGKALLEKQSPLNSASKIKAPLMIIQGANDPRVKKAESDQIVIALRDMGRQVEYVCAPDEGHGFHKPVNNMAALGRAEVFLGKITGARYQEEMKPELAKRLQEITVDPKSLSLAKKIEIAALKEMPKPTSDLTAGTYNYNVTIEMSGQKMEMPMTRTIKEENGNWVVTDAISNAMFGNPSDRAVYTKWTLKPVSRKVIQGEKTQGEFTFSGNKVDANVGGTATSETINGVYVLDGVGDDMIFARLPLGDGYQTGIYVSGQDGKTKLNRLSVVGKETIAGVACYKCEIAEIDNPNDAATYYISIDKKMAMKMVAPITEIPGAVMTVELKN